MRVLQVTVWLIISFGLAFHDGASNTSTLFAGSWCTHSGAKVTVGDFNGNGYDDLLCYDEDGRHWLMLDTVFVQNVVQGPCVDSFSNGFSIYLSGLTGWCTQRTAAHYIGDFNGDGRDDLLCNTRQNMSISFADNQGNLNARWCHVEGESTYVGDFNRDGRADLLCHNPSSDFRWVSLSAAGTYFNHADNMGILRGWCFPLPNKLHVGDFNGDQADDILCHSSVGMQIAYAQVAGTDFFGFDDDPKQFSSWCTQENTMLSIAYLNEDTLADLICHDDSGYTCALVTDLVRVLNNPHSALFPFCPASDERFLIGYFLDVNRQQLLCATNPYWKIISNFV